MGSRELAQTNRPFHLIRAPPWTVTNEAIAPGAFPPDAPAHP